MIVAIILGDYLSSIYIYMYAILICKKYILVRWPKYISYIYLDFRHGSWLTAPQTLEISWAIRVMGPSFVIIFDFLSWVPEIVPEP